MTRFIYKILIYFLVLWLFVFIGWTSNSAELSILLLAAVLALVNTLLRPVFILIAFPINFLTFGLASVFANLLSFIIANGISGGIIHAGFWQLLLLSCAIMLSDDLLRILKNKKHPAF